MNLRSVLDTGKDPKELFKFSIVRPIKMLFRSPIVFFISLYMATVYGYLYLLFTTFPRVFQGRYGFSNGSVGLTYLGAGIGAFVGLLFCGIVSDRLVAALTKRYGGIAKPEYRIPVMFIGAFVVPTGLFLYGWAAEKKVHWIAPIIGSGFLGAGMFAIFVSRSVLRLSRRGLIISFRCRPKPTLSMRFRSTLPPYQPLQQSFGLFSGHCFLLRGTACTTPSEWDGERRFLASSQSPSFRCPWSCGYLVSAFEKARYPKSSFD